MSTIDENGQPIIVVSAMTMAESMAYGRFLMAHECSHHTLGHVAAYHRELGHLGPQPFFYIAPKLKHMELDADCNAVKMLKLKNEPETIEAARQMMLKFGGKPTGAYYPTGAERADNIAKCAAQYQAAFPRSPPSILCGLDPGQVSAGAREDWKPRLSHMIC